MADQAWPSQCSTSTWAEVAEICRLPAARQLEAEVQATPLKAAPAGDGKDEEDHDLPS